MPAQPAGQSQPIWVHTLGRYQSPSGIASAVCILLGIQAVTNVLQGFLHLALSGMKPLIPGSLTQPSDTVGTAGLLFLIMLLGSVAWIATVVCWCVWNYRAHWNISAFGATGLRFTPGWAIGWYFVPFMQLLRPYQAMEEIWKASDPNVELRNGMEWHNGSVPSIVPLWWSVFLVPLIIAILASVATYSPNTAQSWAPQQLVTGLHNITFAVDAVLAILMVRQLTARQEEKYRGLYNAFYAQPQPQTYPSPPTA